ncbi:hypothetical protein F2Q68_00018770 [Brassica cretica]|uniref:Uncharacterized protein n=2 Tax=Brassica cretica TaxID=69181 RepID=A0A8S9FRM9_BRACR|nr:hypothetical protein F2Q68_00018770 [Brassica cretica]
MDGTRVEDLTSEKHASQGRHITETQREGTCPKIRATSLHRHANHCRRTNRTSTSPTRLHHESQPNPLKTIDLEPRIYASKSTSIICDQSKNNMDSQIESRLGKGEIISVDQKLIPEQPREKTGERTVLSEPPLPGAKAGETGAVRATVSRRRKLSTAV